MEIKNNLLQGKNIVFQQTPNTSGEFKKGNLDTIVIHYTAGSNAQSSINSLTNKSVKASAHIVIGRDGKIYQLAPFNFITWHAGESQHQNRKGLNNYSIGIELDNAGLLEKSGNLYTSWFKKSYPQEEVFFGVHQNESIPRYWHNYTQEQIEACYNLCELLVKQYGIKFILGHEEISPGRKIDPGPAFPLDQFRLKLINNDRSSDKKPSFPKSGVVTAAKLNVRKGPGAENERFPEQLEKGKSVTILEEKNGWYKIEIVTTGWVSKDFVK